MRSCLFCAPQGNQNSNILYQIRPPRPALGCLVRTLDSLTFAEKRRDRDRDRTQLSRNLKRWQNPPFVGLCLVVESRERGSELERVTLQGNVQLVFSRFHFSGLLIAELVELKGIPHFYS